MKKKLIPKEAVDAVDYLTLERLLKTLYPERTYTRLLEEYVKNPHYQKGVSSISWIANAFRKIVKESSIGFSPSYKTNKEDKHRKTGEHRSSVCCPYD